MKRELNSFFSGNGVYFTAYSLLVISKNACRKREGRFAEAVFALRVQRSEVGILGAIGAIGALLNRVRQPRPLIVLGLNVGMGTAAGADEQ
jgi:hypothetical protein